MTTTTTTFDADDLKTALAHRDREWEECLRTIDDRPPLVPDREWFREWAARVKKKLTKVVDDYHAQE